jgi:mRNA-degrading endonuclease RelE of RelBE toxin-antitoxin system
MLRGIQKRYGRKTYETLRELIPALETHPAGRGQPLRSPLHGLFAVHYSRFRVIHAIEDDRPRVLVVAAGHHRSGQREGVYQVRQRLVDSGQIVIPKGQGDRGSERQASGRRAGHRQTKDHPARWGRQYPACPRLGRLGPDPLP